jgi:hypothetical protein
LVGLGTPESTVTAAMVSYKEREAYASMSDEDKMAYTDTAFAEFITPTEEGVSPLAMNEVVMGLVEKAKKENVSFSEKSDAAIKTLNEFLITKLNLTEEEVAAIRSNARYNAMRRSIIDEITRSVDESKAVTLREQRQNEDELKQRQDELKKKTLI